jgi:hypothetical protein
MIIKALIKKLAGINNIIGVIDITISIQIKTI